MTCYKLTGRDGYTRCGYSNETLWGEGVTHAAKGYGGLCTDGVIHAYSSPELALFMNPVHANINNPLVWECDGETLVEDDGTKQGYRTLTTLRTIEVAAPTSGQCVAFAILCIKATGYADAAWNEWADNWLNGADQARTDAVAYYAARAAACAAQNGARAAARTGAWASCAAACAAYASKAASCAAFASKSAAYAVCASKAVGLVAIAKQAMETTEAAQ